MDGAARGDGVSHTHLVSCALYAEKLGDEIKVRAEALNGEPNPAKWTKWSTKVENEVERFY